MHYCRLYFIGKQLRHVYILQIFLHILMSISVRGCSSATYPSPCELSPTCILEHMQKMLNIVGEEVRFLLAETKLNLSQMSLLVYLASYLCPYTHIYKQVDNTLGYH